MATGAAPTPAQAQEYYNKLKRKEGLIMQRLSEMQAKHAEHKQVIATLETKEPERRCYRMVGGVLAERTVEDLLPELRAHYTELGKVVESLRTQSKQTSAELDAMLKKYGQVNPAEAAERAAKAAAEARAKADASAPAEAGSTGVLVSGSST